MKRWRPLLGILVLVFIFFGVASYFLPAADTFFTVKLHLVLAVITGTLFFLSGGLEVFRRQAVRRASKHGARLSIYSLTFITALVIINFVAARYIRITYDSTAEKVYSLSPQAIAVLKQLKDSVTVRTFPLTGEADFKLADLMERFSERSTNVHFISVDPNREPQLLERFSVTEPDTSIFTIREGTTEEKIVRARGALDEAKIVEAIQKLTRTDRPTIYYTVGHGERDLESGEPGGFKELAIAIAKEGFLLAPLYLGSSAEVPKDARALLIVAPQRIYPRNEFDAVAAYLKKGGSLVILSEPTATEQLSELVRPFGIQIGKDVVIDTIDKQSDGAQLGVQPLITTFAPHPLTEGFRREIIFSTTSSVRHAVDSDLSGTVAEVAFTGKNSWAESRTDKVFSATPSAELDDLDLPGPVPVVAAFEGNQLDSQTGRPSRVAVFGDSDFASNINLGIAFNRDFILNAVNWSAGVDEAVTIRPRSIRESAVGLTERQWTVLLMLLAILLPELIVISGFVVWLRRQTV